MYPRFVNDDYINSFSGTKLVDILYFYIRHICSHGVVTDKVAFILAACISGYVTVLTVDESLNKKCAKSPASLL